MSALDVVYDCALESGFRLTQAHRGGRVFGFLRGPLGAGEASPLPGYAPDDARAVRESFERFGPDYVTDAAEVAQRGAGWLETGHAPSLLAALEASLVVSSGPPLRPLCNALVPAGLSEAEALERAEQAWASGVTTLKVKIRRASDAPRIDALARRLGPALRLRIDGNQTLGADGADALFAALEGETRARIEYLEQPFAEGTAVCDMRAPLALDESLRDTAAAATWLGVSPDALRAALAGEAAPNTLALNPAPPLRALVLKPAVLGGATRCARWTAIARAAGLDAVWTHTFEGPLGFDAVVRAAGHAADMQIAHGLAPYRLEGAVHLAELPA